GRGQGPLPRGDGARGETRRTGGGRLAAACDRTVRQRTTGQTRRGHHALQGIPQFDRPGLGVSAAPPVLAATLVGTRLPDSPGIVAAWSLDRGIRPSREGGRPCATRGYHRDRPHRSRLAAG